MAAKVGSRREGPCLPRYLRAMQAPRLPAMLGIFRQRRLRGFDYTPRYYDPVEEERKELIERARAQGMQEANLRRDDLRARMRHSWQRDGGDRASMMRLVVIMGMVCVILYFIIKGFGLLDPSAWPT